MTLSDRQQRMYDFIREFFQENQYPPTIREIGEAVDISSTSVVNYNLNKLVDAGLIERNKEVSRGIRLTETPGFSVGGLFSRSVPILGHIAAGQPITVFPDEPRLRRHARPGHRYAWAGRRRSTRCVSRATSMIDALVDSGDLVILNYQKTANNGDMVAAWLIDREETTLKYFFLEGNQVRLQPANANYDPIIVPAGTGGDPGQGHRHHPPVGMSGLTAEVRRQRSEVKRQRPEVGSRQRCHNIRVGPNPFLHSPSLCIAPDHLISDF